MCIRDSRNAPRPDGDPLGESEHAVAVPGRTERLLHLNTHCHGWQTQHQDRSLQGCGSKAQDELRSAVEGIGGEAPQLPATPQVAHDCPDRAVSLDDVPDMGKLSMTVELRRAGGKHLSVV